MLTEFWNDEHAENTPLKLRFAGGGGGGGGIRI